MTNGHPLSQADHEDWHKLIQRFIIDLRAIDCPEFWTDARVDEAIQASVEHHAQHIIGLGITQSRIDQNKVISWLAFALRDVAHAAGQSESIQQAPLAVAVQLMSELLKAHTGNTKGLTTQDQRELLEMASRDLADPEHGIGRNGLYMAFNIASRMTRSARSSSSRRSESAGWG